MNKSQVSRPSSPVPQSGNSQWQEDPLVGKLVVIGVFVVALTAASFALWWNITRAQRSLEFWGKDAVRAIQHGKQVELLELQPAPAPSSDDAGSSGERLLEGRDLFIQGRVDLSQARGLVHARHALTDDSSFAWDDAEKSAAAAEWTHAIRFRDERNTEVLLLLDLRNRRLENVATQRAVTIIPKISEGWQIFIAKQLARTASGTATGK